MSAPPIKRKIRFLEHQWPWFLFAAFVSAFFAVAAAMTLAGMLNVEQGLRGYTGTGLFLGGAAVFLALLTFAYSWRKRTFQERLPIGRFTMMTWLWIHVYFGLLAIVAAVLHAGFGLFSGGLSSGKLLAATFLLLGGSGIAWRLAYRFVPPAAAPKIGNYSKEGAKKRADEQLTEIEKLAAGKSPQFHAWKQAALASPAQAAALAQRAAPGLPPNERADVDPVLRLIASRARALQRMELQVKYVKWLQWWRVVHVPLTFLGILLLVWHVVRALGLDDVARADLVVFSPPITSAPSSADCASCHKSTYDAWKHSMHAHALGGPLMVAQNDLDLRTSLTGAKAPDPRNVCVNCHGPVGTAITGKAELPMASARAMEGVDCVACHQFGGHAPKPGSAGLASWQGDLAPGPTMLGPFKDAVGNGYHRSEANDLQQTGDLLCASCHDVNYDRDGDGKIAKGTDLVLQQTYDEYLRYRKAGGKETCVSCHMPVVRGATRAADGASIPFEQDYAAPAREVHDHAFVGVDYPLDVKPDDDAQKAKREALLRTAATLEIKADGAAAGKTMKVTLTITNTSGHDLPTGFAFARQMWLEVVATSGKDRFFSSGVLAKNTDDLCDQAAFDEPKDGPIRKSLEGCSDADPQLVNIQTKLLDKILPLRDENGKVVVDDNGEAKLAPADGARETVSQFLTGGAVVRVRPSDKQALAPLEPGERRTFVYAMKAPFDGDVTIHARLRFRNLPPYWLRALASEQTAKDPVQIAPLIENLQIADMAEASLTLTP